VLDGGDGFTIEFTVFIPSASRIFTSTSLEDDYPMCVPVIHVTDRTCNNGRRYTLCKEGKVMEKHVVRRRPGSHHQ
jgi:hypothetical protein